MQCQAPKQTWVVISVSVKSQSEEAAGCAQSRSNGPWGCDDEPWGCLQLGRAGGSWVSLGGGGLPSPPALPSPSPAEGLKGGFQMRSLQTALLGNQHLSQQISRLAVFSFPFSPSLGAFSPPPEYPTSSV